MPVQRGVVRPEFREPDQTPIEGIQRHIVGDTPIRPISCIDQSLEMWQDAIDDFRRKPQCAEYRYCWLHLLPPSFDIDAESGMRANSYTASRFAIDWQEIDSNACFVPPTAT
jgi:hypothetical protein